MNETNHESNTTTQLKGKWFPRQIEAHPQIPMDTMALR